MLITKNKKNYAASMEFKEGKPMYGEMDVKGIAIKKSSTNRNASAIFEKILEWKIIKCEGAPNIIEILEELENFQKEIKRSLHAGENTYLKPVNVKDVVAYADPLTNQGVRGAMIWNAVYPEKELIFPDSFFLVKTTLTKPKDLEKLEDKNIAKILEEEVFNNPEKRIKSKGVYVVAIPRDEPVPDWVKPFIDEDQIVEDTMKAFLPIMNAVGLQTIYTSSNSESMSSYIEL